MKEKHYAAAALISFLVMTGTGSPGQETGNPPAPGTAGSGTTVQFSCPLPLSEEAVNLQATLPEGWKRNPDFGTVVFEPGDAAEYFEAPSIEVTVLCEGECQPEVIPDNIAFFRPASPGRLADPLDRKPGNG